MKSSICPAWGEWGGGQHFLKEAHPEKPRPVTSPMGAGMEESPLALTGWERERRLVDTPHFHRGPEERWPGESYVGGIGTRVR